MQPDDASRSAAAALSGSPKGRKYGLNIQAETDSLERLPAQPRATELIQYEQDVALASDLAHHRGVG